jgi:hypothetical protein
MGLAWMGLKAVGGRRLVMVAGPSSLELCLDLLKADWVSVNEQSRFFVRHCVL